MQVISPIVLSLFTIAPQQKIPCQKTGKKSKSSIDYLQKYDMIIMYEYGWNYVHFTDTLSV